MKDLKRFFVLGVLVILSSGLHAQNENKLNVDVNVDIVSRYMWRGLDFGNAPAVQPGLSLTTGNLSFGAWGSYTLSSNTGGMETDLFLSYAISEHFSIGLTDYFFPSEALLILEDHITPVRTGNYFDYDAHLLELNLGYTQGDFSLSGNYLLHGNEEDIYVEAGYTIGKVSLFLGGGNEQYTEEGDFELTNIGISTSKEVKVSEVFTPSLSATLAVNPNNEMVHFIVGISF
ncbi:hypothetical protein EYV94_26170 [Puteibacter caeruleilacunae]|nr:hypothetical protein EYV94_26170 [Puteibacter caeruleilacunae]